MQQAMRLRIVRQTRDHARDVGGRAARRAIARGGVMVADRDRQVWMGDGQSARLQLCEGVVRPFMDKMAIDPQKRRPIRTQRHLMHRPKLVEKGAPVHSAAWARAWAIRLSAAIGSQYRLSESPARSSDIDRWNRSGR